MTLEGRDIHVVTGTLKSFLRELPDALLTWELYECFLAAIGSFDSSFLPLMPLFSGVKDSAHQLECLRKVIDLLPPLNKAVLARLMETLNKVSSNSQVCTYVFAHALVSFYSASPLLLRIALITLLRFLIGSFFFFPLLLLLRFSDQQDDIKESCDCLCANTLPTKGRDIRDSA